MFWDFDADLVVAAVENVIVRKIGDRILIAQLVADVLERLIQIIHVIGIKGAAAGFFREFLKNLVAIGQVILAVAGLGRFIILRQGNPLDAGADGVDDDAGALGHFDGFGTRVV